MGQRPIIPSTTSFARIVAFAYKLKYGDYDKYFFLRVNTNKIIVFLNYISRNEKTHYTGLLIQ